MRVNRSVLSLTAGHFFVDTYSSMLGALLPFLHVKLDLSLTQSGVLAGALVFSSSLMQPAYGYLSDRFPHKLFVALAPAIAGVFICSMGIAPNFNTLLLLVILGGIGIATFHPQGAAEISGFPNRRPGFQMSIFITGGMIGYALGPVYITSMITLVGLGHSYWAALPGVLMSIYLLLYGPSPRKTTQLSNNTQLREILREKLRPIITLYLLVVIRSINHLVFVAFLPLYFTMRGYSEVRSAQFLTLFLLAGGIAGFLGGTLSDRFGGKSIITVSTLLSCPLLLGFLNTRGSLSIVLCALGGAFLLVTAPVNLAMAQKLVRRGASTVSALMMGFAWGVGGLFVPLVGWLSDAYGLQLILNSLVLLTAPGFLLVFGLPSHNEIRGPQSYTGATSLSPSSDP